MAIQIQLYLFCQTGTNGKRTCYGGIIIQQFNGNFFQACASMPANPCCKVLSGIGGFLRSISIRFCYLNRSSSQQCNPIFAYEHIDGRKLHVFTQYELVAVSILIRQYRRIGIAEAV